MEIRDIIKSSGRPLVIAHRGASFYHRENTIAAFEAALEMRPEMVEFDVRRTADGVLVVHHDPDIVGGEIRGMSKAQVEDASASAGYAIPTLQEVLELLKDGVVMDIEVKEAGYEEQVVEDVLGIVEPDRFLISSSHDEVIRKVKGLRPEIRTGLVLYWGSFPGCLARLLPAGMVARSGADVLVVSDRLIRLGFKRLNTRLGKPVWVYTINDRKRMWKHITDPGIGGIFTDRPDVGLFLRDLFAVGKQED